MRIIISPAKQMVYEDVLEYRDMPVYLDKTEQLMKYLKGLSYDELKRLLACNDKIAELNYDRYSAMDLKKGLTPAVMSYDGIQYKYMQPQVLDEGGIEYLDRHLRILSGFYGALRPFDGVVMYRLEMQARLKTDFCKNLYDFWGADIYNAVRDEVILNLASEEYSKAVRRFAEPGIRFVDCVFGSVENGRIKEKGVYVKMARGEMVRLMAENRIEDIEDIKKLDVLNFRYNAELSDKDRFVFIA